MSNEFKWTDELVNKCYRYLRDKFDNPNKYNGQWDGIAKEIDQFKQPYTPKEDNRASEILKAIRVGAQITTGGYNAVKRKIKSVLLGPNSVIFEDGFSLSLSNLVEGIKDGVYKIVEEDKKDWEVTCAAGFTKEGGLKIITVKRLSDNEVFSVGDEVEYCCYGELDGSWFPGRIEKIKQAITLPELEFTINDNGGFVNKFIRHIKKLKPKEQPHKCQYCGSITTAPDSECWNNPDRKSKQGIGHADWFEKIPRNTKPKEQPPQRKDDVLGNVYYSQKKVDELCEKAFNAAKLRNLNPDFNWHTYKTYQDFKKQQ